jgi:predicted permease
VRSLRRTPAFTITAALTLVVGVAATVSIATVVNGVLLRPLPYGNPDRLVGAWHDMAPINITRANQTWSTYLTYRRHTKTIEDIALYTEGAQNVSEPGGAAEPQRLRAGFITASLVPVLQVPPLLGRSFTDDEDRPKGPAVVMISEGLWRARFGGAPDVVGAKLEVNGSVREIIGVMPARFRFPEAATQLWLPLALDPSAAFPGGFSYNSVARMKPGVTIAEVQRDFAAVLPRVTETSPMMAPGVPMSMLLEQAKPVPVISSMREDITGSIARTLWMVAGAAGLVLLVACFNVANLILVRADARQRELAVREALGAGRARILGHFLAESAVLAGVAAVVGSVVAWGAVRVLVLAGPRDIPRLAEVGVDWMSIVFAVGIAALIALLCSVLPALRIGRVLLANALREGGRAGTGRAQHRVRGALVAGQIALALVVLASSALLLRTYRALTSVQPGFDARDVATLWLSPAGTRYSDSTVVRFYGELLDRVAALPGVKSVGISSRLPLVSYGMNQNPFFAENDPRSDGKIPPLQLFATTDGGYFAAVGARLLAGRTFERIPAQREQEAIVSRLTAETFWQTPQNAVGKRFRPLPTGPWYTVIGVVETMRDTSLAAPPTPAVYFPQALPASMDDNQVRGTMALVVRTSGLDPASVIPSVQRVVRDLDPSLPTFDAQPMHAVVERSMARLSFVMVILASAAVVTLLLGAIGLYGVMAYLVTLRTRELGVRIALGAAPGAVAAMLTRQGSVLAAAGIAAGLAAFALMARFLQSFLYGVAPLDPVSLSAATLTLAAIAVLASWIPARRAARVDPATSLRAE